MFKKKLMLAFAASMTLMIGCSGLAMASDGVYYDDDDSSNVIVIGDNEDGTESETLTESETETSGFTVNTDGFSYIGDEDETETPETTAAVPETAQLIALNVNTRIKEKEPETEVETETETESETEERTATLPKTGDFNLLDEIFNGLQDALWALR